MHRHRQKQHGKVTRPLFWYYSERQTIDRYVEKGRLKKINCRPDGVKPVNLHYVLVPDKDLNCPICYEPVWRPTLLPCGHRFCEDCLHDAVLFQETDRNIKSCPYCRAETPEKFWSEQGPDAIHPTYPHEQLDQALVKCPNEPEGCDMVLERHLVPTHVIRHCMYTGKSSRRTTRNFKSPRLTVAELKCPDETCDKPVLRRYLTKWDGCLHQKKQCQRPTCQAEFEAWEQAEHDQRCAAMTSSCPSCSEIITRDQLAEHTASCKRQCSASKWGCTFRSSTPPEVEAHEASCPIIPLSQMLARQQSVLSSYSDALQWADIGSIGSVLQNLMNFTVQQDAKIQALERELVSVRQRCDEAEQAARAVEASVRNDIPSLQLHLLNTEDAQNRTNLMLESGITRLGSETAAQWDALESLRRISVNPLLPMMRPPPGAVTANMLHQHHHQRMMSAGGSMALGGQHGALGAENVAMAGGGGDTSSEEDFPLYDRIAALAGAASAGQMDRQALFDAVASLPQYPQAAIGEPLSRMMSAPSPTASAARRRSSSPSRRGMPVHQQYQPGFPMPAQPSVAPSYPRRRSSAERSTKL